jgi:superfamily I DNA/RNA helicase
MAYMSFEEWLNEMAERPQPDKDWGYSHSGEYQGRPTKNQWIKKGQRAVPAFTTDAELYDPHMPHSEYEKAAYKLNKPKGAPSNAGLDQPQPTATAPQPAAPPKSTGGGPWILATAKVDEMLPDHNGTEHKIKKGQHVALKDNADGSWAYATIWKGKLQWHNAHMPKSDLPGRFESVKPLVRGNKASDLAKSVHKEEKKDFKLTEEQQDIADTFKKNKESKDANHMTINALAGTGKTTMLKHLAEKYGKRGEKWLYLVFGRKNREEASGEFPDFVDVYTTNSYAGEVLKANTIKPTERIAEYGDKVNKVEEIIDGDQYKQVANSVNIPHFDQSGMSNYIKGYMKGIWREFNKEVQKLVGLGKAYNLNPDEAQEGIAQIAKEHDINTPLEKTKEKLEKDSNSDFFNEQISDFMGLDDFSSKDFLEEMIACASWVLDKSQPHGIDQDFMQNKEKKNGRWSHMQQPVKRNLRTLRDFDDDLWYAAQHADQLDWTKPKKYQYVLVDEVQDFNKSQKVLLEQLVAAGARIVAVGDPNQGMYRFRGADDAAFKDITAMLKSNSSNSEGTEKTLTKNFRSKPGIIDHSNKNSVVNNLVAGREHDPHDEAHISDREIKYDETIDRLGEEHNSLGEMKKQTAFIARTNEPLAKAAMDLLKQKIPFVIYGKDMAGEITNVVNRVLMWQKYKVVDNNSGMEDFIAELDDFVSDKQEKWSGKATKAGPLKDLMEAQKALHAATEVAAKEQDYSVEEFKTWLWKRLGGVPDHMKPAEKARHKKMLEEQNPVILTTAHRSKGLEFDRVFELTPSLYPHPRTKLDADFAQEENSRYVAMTRAKDEYHVVDDTEDE